MSERNAGIHDAAGDKASGQGGQKKFAGKTVFFRRRRRCPLQGLENQIHYNNVKLLERFVSDRGRMLPSRITSVSPPLQRKLKVAIKQARILGLLPFTKN